MTIIADTTEKHPYPAKVYDAVDEEISLEVAEKIASTKPDWAAWEDTDFLRSIAGPTAEFPGSQIVFWQRKLTEDVTVSQECQYTAQGEHLHSARPTSEVFIFDGESSTSPDPRTAEHLLAGALQLIRAAFELGRYTDPYAPIISPEDDRYQHLKDWIGAMQLERRKEGLERSCDIEDLNGIEAGEWYARRVLGLDGSGEWFDGNDAILTEIRDLASRALLTADYAENN